VEIAIKRVRTERPVSDKIVSSKTMMTIVHFRMFFVLLNQRRTSVIVVTIVKITQTGVLVKPLKTVVTVCLLPSHKLLHPLNLNRIVPVNMVISEIFVSRR
jgi:hypothetical protein